MITFTSREAKNRLGKVFRAAMSDVVEITSHGKPLVRVLSIEKEERRRASNIHCSLNVMKHKIACTVLSTFPINIIRQSSLENLNRWRAQGTWSQSYDEWLQILQNPDDLELISCMVGTSERSNRLRQSMPYVGMLDQSIVRKIHEEIGN